MSSPLRVFLTGCASGIGQHLADVFLDAGHVVFATDLDEPRLQAHAQAWAWPADRGLVAQLDVSCAVAWARVFARAVAEMGAVDVLINVAGYLLPGYVGEFATEEVDRHLDINTKGVIFGTHTAAKHMVSRGCGHIINIASLAGLAPVPGLGLYSASKYAVRGFSLAVAQELRLRGVAVTVVCPDAVHTPMLTRQVAYREAALTFSGSRVLRVGRSSSACCLTVRSKFICRARGPCSPDSPTFSPPRHCGCGLCSNVAAAPASAPCNAETCRGSLDKLSAVVPKVGKTGRNLLRVPAIC